MDRCRAGLLTLVLLAAAPAASAQADPPRWRDLPPRVQGILGPIEQDWAAMDAPRRRTWIGIAESYERMTPGEQQNLLSRMRAWSRLSPRSRAIALDRYREWLSIPPEQREALREKWEQYQNLPPDERTRPQPGPPQ